MRATPVVDGVVGADEGDVRGDVEARLAAGADYGGGCFVVHGEGAAWPAAGRKPGSKA